MAPNNNSFSASLHLAALAMIEDGKCHSPNVQTDISVITSEHQEESLIKELQVIIARELSHTCILFS